MLTYQDLKSKKKSQLIEIILNEKLVTTGSVDKAVKAIFDMNINEEQENFILICLNSTNKVLKKKVIFKGGLSSCTIDFKVIFKELLSTKYCTKFIVAHNHPSDNLEPSVADEKMTMKLKESAQLLAFQFLDHIVFNNFKFFSFLEKGLL